MSDVGFIVHERDTEVGDMSRELVACVISLKGNIQEIRVASGNISARVSGCASLNDARLRNLKLMASAIYPP